MYYDSVLEGKYIRLKSIKEEDAEFTLSIRQDAEIIKYLPRLNHNIEQQREWIKKQQQRPDEYFFVAFDREDNPIGTYGLYDIKTKDSAESGRMAMKGNVFQNFETQLLAYKFAFEKLGLSYIYGFIYASNIRNQRFNISFGADIEKESMNMYGTKVVKCVCHKERFYNSIPKLESFLYR